MENIKRRSFLKIAGGASMLPWTGDHFGKFLGYNQMNRRVIPSSGEKIPVVGLGTWQQFDIEIPGAASNQLSEVLKNMLDKGGRVIDSSPMYGRSESAVGALTQAGGQADSFFYATKVWTNGKEEGIRQMEASMQKMRRKRMDLMQVHNLLDLDTHLKTLKQWKSEQKISYMGATHYSVSAHKELERLIEREKMDFIQFNYNLKERNAEKSLLSRAGDKGVAVIINEPFASGSLFQTIRGKELPPWAAEWEISTWAQFFLKYILSNPAVTCVIPGTSNPKHVLDNMGAGYGNMPDETARKKMATYFDSL